MEWLWAQLTELYWNVFYRPDWRDVLDILIVAFLIYQILRFTRQTRGSSVFKGILYNACFRINRTRYTDTD